MLVGLSGYAGSLWVEDGRLDRVSMISLNERLIWITARLHSGVVVLHYLMGTCGFFIRVVRLVMHIILISCVFSGQFTR